MIDDDLLIKKGVHEKEAKFVLSSQRKCSRD